MADPQQRPMTVDLIPPKESRRAIINSIRHYRAALREAFALLFVGKLCSATIEADGDDIRVVPNGPVSALVLGLALGQATAIAEEPRRNANGTRIRGDGDRFTVQMGRGQVYELRAHLVEELSSMLSFVADSARRDVATAWTAKDPEFTRADRGWLALHGARALAQFNYRGIGFPVATAKPRLDGYNLTLRWDREMGDVEFRLPQLDGGRRHVWLNLRDGEPGWKLGTVFLNERDGRLFATLSHSRPMLAAEVDPSRTCRVRFGETVENFLVVSGPDGAASFDTISAADAVGRLIDQRARRTALEARKAACGNPRRPWGHRKGWLANQDVLTRATQQRENGVKHNNHAWTRRIVTRAVAWRCGVIEVQPRPDGLFGQEWRWSQLVEFLRYKAGERGINLVLLEKEIVPA